MPTILVQPEYSLNSWCQSSSYQTHTHTQSTSYFCPLVYTSTPRTTCKNNARTISICHSITDLICGVCKRCKGEKRKVYGL